MKRVCSLVDQGLYLSYRIWRGLRAFSVKTKAFEIQDGMTDGSSTYYVDPGAEGIIAFIADPARGRELELLDKPVINVSARWPLKFPVVSADDVAVGKLAAEHFLERSFVKIAVVTSAGTPFEPRADAFGQTLEAAGMRCEKVMLSGNAGDEELLQKLVERLGRPGGIYCTTDRLAVRLSEMCRRMGVQVPGEVALLGTDNDEMYCDLALPPLSSVAISWERIGWEAGALMAAKLAGKELPMRTLIEPSAVVPRASTRTLGIADRDVLAAVRYIHSQAHRAIAVEDVLQVVPLSRRTLERRFHELLGRSPQQEIRRVHVVLARQLLTDPMLSVEQVAGRAGFRSADWMTKVFRAELGTTPREYRASLVRA